MNENDILAISIENVINLINNSILLIREFDKELKKLGYSPYDENNLGNMTSNFIHQNPSDEVTIFPKYISRTYTENYRKKSKKIIQISIQFYHEKQHNLAPQIISSVIVIPLSHSSKYESYWIADIAFKFNNYDDLLKNGEINRFKDSSNFLNIFWFNDLIKFNNPTDVKNECLKIQKEFENASI
ncbi:hypothetical protein ACFSY7_17885 [Kurthia populi]|uniref:Uncharacterized protein n=1 Tax=Kurthia populi TaxID=1562132 RepID=A0ABW5Y513_9BACL